MLGGENSYVMSNYDMFSTVCDDLPPTETGAGDAEDGTGVGARVTVRSWKQKELPHKRSKFACALVVDPQQSLVIFGGKPSTGDPPEDVYEGVFARYNQSGVSIASASSANSNTTVPSISLSSKRRQSPVEALRGVSVLLSSTRIDSSLTAPSCDLV